MAEKITILETFGPFLTKVYLSDGNRKDYDEAASFKVREKDVSDIASLSAVLTELQDKPKCCQIHGKFVGKDKATPGDVPGSFRRKNENFDDQALHTFPIDIDKYKPPFGDPVDEAEICIDGFLRSVLPKEFHNVSYHWQLSSSAGEAKNLEILKAHVWFWLETPRKCSELKAWAKVIGPQVDQAVYVRAQARYTANPIFEEGREDPVAIRSGLVRRSRDTLDLVIPDDVLALARDQGAGQGGNDMKLVDPSEKDNLIGLFHKAFSAEQVMLELLEGEFEQVTQRRWTWTNGGGSPEGVWVHDDDMHVGSSHNTWPAPGILNLWDLVRVFKFGDLDKSDDPFEQTNIDALPIQAKPSSVAMFEYAAGLEAVKQELITERSGPYLAFKGEIDAAPDTYTLEHLVAPRIRAATDLDVSSRAKLENAFKERMAAVPEPAKMSIKDIRQMLAPPRTARNTEGPGWNQNWVWIIALDKFMNVVTKELMSITSYNACFDRYMRAFADEDGNVPKASDASLNLWGMITYSDARYNPAAGEVFVENGLEYINTYRADCLPAVPDSLTVSDKKAIKTVETHLEILVPNARDRNLLIDFMAYCVQHPGKKIRWAPLIIGMEGDGKTAILTLMGRVMGSRNFRILNNKTLESDFTGWSTGQCLIGVEEVKLHNHNRFDIFNVLKPIISNDTIEVHAKGKDPVTVPNTNNLILLTNHPDAMPVSGNDRRIFFLRSPFNSKEDLYAAVKAKTGMDAPEFHDELFDVAIKLKEGALRKWLLERTTFSEDFKPNGRAPENDMRSEAIELSRSDEEVAIVGVTGSTAFGIYPNLIAGGCLTKALLDQYDLKVSTTRLSGAMTALGWTSGGQARWSGHNYRWYFRGEKPDNINATAKALEAARLEALVAGDFDA